MPGTRLSGGRPAPDVTPKQARPVKASPEWEHSKDASCSSWLASRFDDEIQPDSLRSDISTAKNLQVSAMIVRPITAPCGLSPYMESLDPERIPVTISLEEESVAVACKSIWGPKCIGCKLETYCTILTESDPWIGRLPTVLPFSVPIVSSL